MKQIRVQLDTAGIDKLIQELDSYKEDLRRKSQELVKRAADYGVEIVNIHVARSSHLGGKDFNVTAKPNKNGYTVIATGEHVLFIEFGAGITYGLGHPEAQEHGMGPGTYPNGKGHWNDPKGWYLPASAGGGHTYGNPPYAPMYEARKAIEMDLPRLVREVFGSD